MQQGTAYDFWRSFVEAGAAIADSIKEQDPDKFEYESRVGQELLNLVFNHCQTVDCQLLPQVVLPDAFDFFVNKSGDCQQISDIIPGLPTWCFTFPGSRGLRRATLFQALAKARSDLLKERAQEREQLAAARSIGVPVEKKNREEATTNAELPLTLATTVRSSAEVVNRNQPPPNLTEDQLDQLFEEFEEGQAVQPTGRPQEMSKATAVKGRSQSVSVGEMSILYMK